MALFVCCILKTVLKRGWLRELFLRQAGKTLALSAPIGGLSPLLRMEDPQGYFTSFYGQLLLCNKHVRTGKLTWFKRGVMFLPWPLTLSSLSSSPQLIPQKWHLLLKYKLLNALPRESSYPHQRTIDCLSCCTRGLSSFRCQFPSRQASIKGSSV